MTNRERCINFIAKYPDVSAIVSSRQAGEELTDLYYRLTGKIVRCSGCASEALVVYSSIENYIKRDSNPEHPFNKNKIMTNYKLKKDVLAYSNTYNRHFTNDSMTDEVGATIISENENNLQLFEEYPSDYEKDVEAIKEKKADQIVIEETKASFTGETTDEGGTSTIEFESEKEKEEVKKFKPRKK